MSARIDYLADHYWEVLGGGKMLSYHGPHMNETLPPAVAADFVRRHRAWGALWNYGWDKPDGAPWYGYVCNTVNYEVDTLESKNSRKTVRRSLERCQVRRIEPEWLAEHGYKTYINGTERYRNYRVQTRDEFAREMLALKRMPGLMLYGVFVDEVLAAYGVAFDLGDQTARFRIAVFDPQFSHEKPMYALYYTLANDCSKMGLREIDAGWRPLLHETNIEEFFRRMGWRNAPCRLDIHLRWPLRLILGGARLFRKWLKRAMPIQHWNKLEALLIAQDVVAQSRRPPIPGQPPPASPTHAAHVDGVAPVAAKAGDAD